MEGRASPGIVSSSAGHDKGEIFVALEAAEGRIRLVDGKTRKLSKPKEKSLKHIRYEKAVSPELAEAIRQGTATDRLIRKELAIIRREAGD